MKKIRCILSKSPLLVNATADYMLRSYNSEIGVNYFLSIDNFINKSDDDYIITFDDIANRCISGIHTVSHYFNVACLI